MTKRTIVRVAIAMLFCAQSAAFANFSHPGALHSAAELSFLKSAKQAQRGEWADFDAKANAAYAAALPTPVAEFYCGRVLRGEKRHPACSAMRADGFRAYTLALQWYFTGEQRYGNRSLEIIRLWQKKFCAIRGARISGVASAGQCKSGNYVDDRGQSALEASWIAPHFVNAAEILRYADANSSLWTPTDTVQFNVFLGRLWKELDERSDSASYSNAVWTKIEAMLAIAISTNNQAKFDSAVALWRQRVKTSIYMREDGNEPKHVPARTGRALVHDWNFPRNFDNGQMQNGVQAETCRDLNHADMAFKGKTYSAHMAFNQEVDLFSAYKERIAAFMEFHNAMRNGVISTDVCKSTSLVNKANSVLAAAENSRRSQDNGAAFANKIKAKRDSLKWKKSDVSVRTGNPASYQAALSSLGGAGNQGAWTGLLTQNSNNENFDRHLNNIATIANISFAQQWPNRRPNCYGGKNNSQAYPCGSNGSDIDLWHLAYNHLSHRLGLELPMTRTVIDNYAANGLLVPSQQFIGLSKWETLGGLELGLFSPSYNAGIGNAGIGLDDSNLYFDDSSNVSTVNIFDTGRFSRAPSTANLFDQPSNDAPSSVVRVVGNTISWPDDGWYQVQAQGDYREVCAAGRSCWVPSGIYNVINHTTGQRFEGIRVD